MYYMADIMKRGETFFVSFPDCPGCTTYGDTPELSEKLAKEALEVWLESHLTLGRTPPAPRHSMGTPVFVRPGLSSAIRIRQAREERGWSQEDLARAVGVTQQQISKLESATSNPKVETLEAIANALGRTVSIGFVAC